MSARPRIVVLDGHTLNPGDNPWDPVAALGELTVYERSAREQIVERAAGAEIVLTNKTVLDASTLARLSAVRFIGILATGANVVDLEAASRQGIVVANVPEYGTDSVAQHTFALLLELCQHVGLHDAAVHAGEWSNAVDFCFWKTPLVELAGLTMGIVGYGRIGRRVGELARAFGMRVIASPGRSQRAEAGARFTWKDIRELFAEADVVSLHCPLTAQTSRLVGADLLGRMKPSAFLLNTARGGLIDEHALAAALHAGTIAGAALDVVAAEPPPADNPLLSAPRCIITPHIAWATLAARRRLMVITARNISAFLSGRPINVVAP